MTLQPSAPPPPLPAAPSVLGAQDQADIAQGAREASAAGAQASREMAQAMAQANRDMAQANRQMAQASRDMAQAGPAGNASVIKDGSGRIVVTGPDGKTITIDPKAGLDGDQIQAMVQTALQPIRPPNVDRGPSEGAVAIVAIVFLSLLTAVWLITRAVRRRPAPAGGGPAVLPPETVARLARIEQAVEAVAIEVERISEAQRYSAQLLTERLAPAGPALGGRTAEAPALGAQAARG